jgi:hypothetical protein
MSILSTPTPDYQGQGSTRPAHMTEGLLAWLKSLFHTPTPVYRTAPVPEDGQTQKAKESAR